MHAALDAVGQHYKHFLITKYVRLDELRSSLVELVHEPTGAKILHIANDDPENLFCLSFQTLPANSNGVAHILEHTTLCGSKKYPVKDPFFAMMRRSLNTFMNAFTGQDFTCYPASSQVEKDFYNLLEVYLDAVFHPELKKMSFLQEGHRLEFDEANKLQFKGVVYNEMKGAMMSSESRLWQTIASHLTPDLPYSYNSGGDPKEIPHLSYEELVEFHQTFYHPSRCLFYFYGNLPLAKHLDFIEAHALKKSEKLAPLPPLPLQHRFRAPIAVTGAYPIAEGENPKGKTEISFSWLTAHLSQQSDVLALCLIETFLMETDVSPLKIALLKSGLCDDAESSIDIEMSEVPLTIICKGSDPEHREKLEKTIFDCLRKLVSKPLDPERVEASLHQLEFQRTEIGGEGGPFGLTLFMRAGLIKQHGNEPEHALQIHSLFKELRDRLKNPTYLPSVIEKYLLNNSHFASVALIPDPELEKKELLEEQERLKKIELHLTEKQKEEINRQAKELLAYQEAIEHQSIDCLPKVTLQDVPKKSRDFPLHHREMGSFDLFHHDCFTNKIIYADLLFELPKIEQKDLSMLSLLAKVWTELGAGGKSYEETLEFEQSHTGGVDAHLALHVSALDPDVLKPAFSLRGKALHRKAEPFFELMTSYAAGPDCSNHERIRQWLLQHATELDEGLSSNPLNYAVQMSLKGYSAASMIYNEWNGLPYYHFVKELVKNKSTQWMKRLGELAQLILSNGKPHLILSADQTQAEELIRRQFYALGRREARSTSSPWNGKYQIEEVASQARLISSPLAFTSLGMRTVAYRDADAAFLMISTELLDNVILHKEIREKGGAYGSGASYMPTTGNYHLYSLRDPHVAKTADSFRYAIAQIGEGAFAERELEEAKLGIIAAMDNPVPPGGRAIVAYAWHRAGRTLEERQKLRNQILTATKKEVMDAVKKRLINTPSTLVTLLGQQLWAKEEKQIVPQLTVMPLS